MVNYDARVFRSVANSDGGAKADAAGNLEMRYQHVSVDGNFKSGRCHSRPEMLPDGRLRLHERWQWTDGAEGHGESIIEELALGST